jgi:hypothetical protein
MPGLSISSHCKNPKYMRIRLETRPYRFNTSSDGRMVIFPKTDRDSEAIVRYSLYVILAIASENPSQYIHHTERLGRDYMCIGCGSLDLVLPTLKRYSEYCAVTFSVTHCSRQSLGFPRTSSEVT